MIGIEEPLLTLREFCEVTGLSVHKVRKLMRMGIIKHDYVDNTGTYKEKRFTLRYALHIKSRIEQGKKEKEEAKTNAMKK